MDETLLTDRLPTPVGELMLVADEVGCLLAVDWVDHEARLQRLLQRRHGGATLRLQRNPHGLSTRLAQYFDGDLAVIDTLPVRTGGTAFQCEVWAALRRIPCGTTITYGELARRIGQPRAVRAVGLANGANAIGVVVPCHRVIGSTGALTGYGSGLARKDWLLRHEGARLI